MRFSAEVTKASIVNVKILMVTLTCDIPIDFR